MIPHPYIRYERHIETTENNQPYVRAVFWHWAASGWRSVEGQWMRHDDRALRSLVRALETRTDALQMLIEE